MKKLISIILLISVLTTFSQTENLIYLKLKENIAVFPGIKDFKTFKNTYNQFDKVISDYNITDIKCVFKTKSKKIQSIYYVKYNNTNVDSLLFALNNINIVEYAEKPLNYTFSATVNDPDCSTEQWNLTKIQAQEAWDIYNGGSGYKTKVAIIDAGFKLNHEDLAANFWHNTNEIPNNGIDDDNNGFIDDVNGWDIADNDNNPQPTEQETNNDFGHGTFVCGFVAGVTNNGIGIASVSHNTAEIIPIKVGTGTTNISIPPGTIPAAMDYAMINGAEIISMSLSAQNEDDLGYSNGRTMHEIVQEAEAQGILMLAATGNLAAYYSEISYPARFPEVIAVGSTDENDYKASSSQYSTDVDIMAPGHLVYSTIQEYPWYQGGWSGTSFATPTVAGALALMKSFHPEATTAQLKQCLFSGADNIESIGANTPYAGMLGHGRLNVYKSIRCIDSLFSTNEAPVCVITSPQNGQVFTQGDEVVFSVTATDSDGIIDSVVFVLDSTPFMTYTNEPYQYNIITDTSTPPGIYHFHAIAYDNNLNHTSSDTIIITLNELTSYVSQLKTTEKFIVYPNPVKDYLQIKINNKKPTGNLQIIDITGKIVLSLSLQNSTQFVNVKELQNGIYYARMNAYTCKFIKK